jgi:micrococcal nuclease
MKKLLIAVLFFMLISIACGSSTSTVEKIPTLVSTLVPTATETILVTSIPIVKNPSVGTSFSCIPLSNGIETGKVVRIVDGDTIVVNIDGTEYTVRYIGINTPEKGEPYAEEATNRNSFLVLDQTIFLVKDVSNVDKYDRLLRYVLKGDSLSSSFINNMLVHDGYAKTTPYHPDTACESVFAETEKDARFNLRGVWFGSNKTEAAPTTCDPSYPDVCIAPPLPDLNCGDISYRNFKVIPPDSHGFDLDGNGIGCQE